MNQSSTVKQADQAIVTAGMTPCAHHHPGLDHPTPPGMRDPGSHGRPQLVGR